MCKVLKWGLIRERSGVSILMFSRYYVRHIVLLISKASLTQNDRGD